MKKFIIFILLLISAPSLAVIDIKKETNFKITGEKKQELNEILKLNRLVGKKLLQAINKKKLIVQPHTKIQITELAAKGLCLVPGKSVKLNGVYITTNYQAYASKELLDLLYALINAPEINEKTPFGLLSLFRYGRAHGHLQSNGFLLGMAIDIDTYTGYKINMKNPREALFGIIKVIEHLPPLRYTIGLPRPGGGKLIAPEKDFFLPVTSLSDNERSPTGSLNSDLNLIINNEAKNKLTEVIVKNKKFKILFLMPDAVDHLHIKAIENGAIQ